jgi:hypothetical protein
LIGNDYDDLFTRQGTNVTSGGHIDHVETKTCLKHDLTIRAPVLGAADQSLDSDQ